MSLKSAIRNPQSVIPGLWTLDCSPWTVLVVLWLLLTPIRTSAQVTGGGWTVSLYGIVQVEPGDGVVTLKVKDEQIRFFLQNIQCSDRSFSTERFLSDVAHKKPSLFIKGPEEWLDLLINERPSKRVLQMRGVYYPDSRTFLLHKLGPFQGTPTPE